MANHRGEDAPGTIVPGRVKFLLILLVLAIAGLLFWVIPVWQLAAILTCVVLGVIRPAFMKYVAPFTAQIVVDSLFTKKIRCLRKGFNWLAPGETLGGLVDLKTDITDVAKDETYTSKIGEVIAKYMFSLAPDASSDRALVKYMSYKTDAIRTAARSLFSMMLSDYFRDKSTDKKILDKSVINNLLFKDNPLICAFEEKHGVVVEEIRLEDVDFDAATQAARDTLSKSGSFKDSVDTLVKGGTERPKAENIVRQMMNLPGFTENVVNLTVAGLENLQHFSMAGGVLGGGKPK